MRKTSLALLLILTTSLTSAAETVREFSGNGNTTTAMFTVESPWLLDWRLDGDFDALIALDIVLLDARTGRLIGRVLHTKYKGNGLKLFEEGGRYQLRVSSSLARWRIKIQQITDEEAELYTPRRDNQE
jgi:hypothetical protein